MISISIEFPYIGQLKYCQKLDFEGYPNSNSKYLNIKKNCFLISKSIKFPYTAQLTYCQKLDFEGYPNNNSKYPNMEKTFFLFRIYIYIY